MLFLFFAQILSSVTRPARSLSGMITQGKRSHLVPTWCGRRLSQKVAEDLKSFEKCYVPGPLTVLSEEEEMMRDAGTLSSNLRIPVTI